MDSRIAQLQKALWHAQARVLELEKQVDEAKRWIGNDIDFRNDTLVEALNREARVLSKVIDYDLCRQAFDAGVKAFGERLVFLAFHGKLDKHKVESELDKALNDENFRLEGRP